MQIGGPNGELTSWKEIAAYLGVTVRAAQRWEREKGLPVRRLPGERGRVFASVAEIDRWRLGPSLNHQTRGVRMGWTRFGVVAALLVFIAASGILIYFLSTRPGPPVGLRQEGIQLVATDARGRDVWRAVLEEPLSPDPDPPGTMLAEKRAWFGDLDADGHVELLYIYSPASYQRYGRILLCFSDSGKEKWRFVPGKAVSAGTEWFSPVFFASALLVLPPGADGTRRVFVSSVHSVFYPTQCALLSSSGKLLREYWHSGHLVRLDLADVNNDGAQDVLLGGVSNAHKAATLVVLDPDSMGGASEETPDYQLQGFGPGKENARILFPRTCINRKMDAYNLVFSVFGFQGSVKAVVSERRHLVQYSIIYRLGEDLSVKEMAWDDSLRAYHRELEAAGQLDHSLTEAEVDQMRNIRVLKHWREQPALAATAARRPSSPSPRPSKSRSPAGIQ